MADRPDDESYPAPIALFAFRRPDHLRLTVDALKANELADRSELYVFCDAARSEGEVAAVDQVRAFARTISGFRSVTLIEQPHNLGLAKSIVGGVSEIVSRQGRVVVVEDDLVTSPHFLRFMNDGLSLYADEPKVASIHGYIYPVDAPLPETFFLRGADCWGWATWARAWSKFNPDGAALLRDLDATGSTDRFDMDGSMSYSGMLRDFVCGRNDSWAVRWHASAFLEDMLTLYPGRTLVENIGLDASGTHCGVSSDFGRAPTATAVAIAPIPVEEGESGRRAFVDYFRGSQPEAPTHALPQPEERKMRRPVLQRIARWFGAA